MCLGSQEKFKKKEVVGIDLNLIRTEAHSLDLAIRRLIMTLLRAVSVAREGRSQMRVDPGM